MADTKATLKVIDGSSVSQSLAGITSSDGFSSAHILTGSIASDISASLYHTQSAAKSLYELSGTLNKISESVASGSVYNSTGSAQYLSIISGNLKDYTTALQNISSSVSSSLNIAGTSSAKYLQDISSSLASIGVGQDYSIYLTSSPGVTIAELMADVSASSAYNNTGSAKYLSYISEAVAAISNSSGQDYSTVLNDISSSLKYNSSGSARYLSEISSSISSSLFGTTGNLYAGGKSAATWLSEISSSLNGIKQTLSSDNETDILKQISASLKAIDIDTSNLTRSLDQATASLANISSSITFISQSFYPKISGAYDYATGSYNKLVDISSSMTYVSQSTLGFATGSVITAVSGGNFTSGVYTIQPDNARVSLQILSKVNNKLIYVLIGTDNPTLSPPKYSYEMTPSGSYYAFESDVRLTHKILSGSTTFAADDYILITETKK